MNGRSGFCGELLKDDGPDEGREVIDASRVRQSAPAVRADQGGENRVPSKQQALGARVVDRGHKPRIISITGKLDRQQTRARAGKTGSGRSHPFVRSTEGYSLGVDESLPESNDSLRSPMLLMLPDSPVALFVISCSRRRL